MSGLSAEKLGRLIRLLEEEKKEYEKIRELTDRQAELLTEEKIDELNNSLDRRQTVIDKIEGLHQEKDVLMQSYVSAAPNEKGKGAEEIERLRTEIKSLIYEISEKNNKNMERAKETNEQYGTQSNKLNMSRKSLGLYAQGAMYSGDNFDKKS